MKLDRQLLSIIGRRLPAIVGAQARTSRAAFWRDRWSETALSPQPLPPEPPDLLGAAVAGEFIQTLWMAERFGAGSSAAFDVLDDWCPTVPKGFKRPPWWGPFPVPEPEPRPDWFVDYHIGFAARLAASSADFNGTAMGDLLAKAVDRSLAAISANGARG